MDKNHLKFQSRMVSFLLFPHGIFWIFGDGETHQFFWYGIFPCSALESLALLGFVTRGPLCIGYRRSLNNAKDLGLQFCQVVGCLVVWWVGWLVGWLVLAGVSVTGIPRLPPFSAALEASTSPLVAWRNEHRPPWDEKAGGCSIGPMASRQRFPGNSTELQKAWSFFSFCWMSSSYKIFGIIKGGENPGKLTLAMEKPTIGRCWNFPFVILVFGVAIYLLDVWCPKQIFASLISGHLGSDLRFAKIHLGSWITRWISWEQKRKLPPT